MVIVSRKLARFDLLRNIQVCCATLKCVVQCQGVLQYRFASAYFHMTSSEHCSACSKHEDEEEERVQNLKGPLPEGA